MEKILDFLFHFYEPEFIKRYIEYLLLIVLLASFLEVIFPPIPGDTVLIISGSLAGVAGINPVFIILLASIGSFSASALLYFLGLKLERKMLDSPRFSWFLDSKAFTKIELWFRKYGFYTVLISRFLPVWRSGVILAAGMVYMKKRLALIAVGLSTILSTTFFVVGGIIMGRRWSLFLKIWDSHARNIVLILIGILVVYIIFTKLKKKFGNRSENK